MQAAALLARSALLAIMTNIPPPLLGVELPAVVVALEPADINEASVDTLINALPAPSIDKIWVRVRLPISIEELSSYLKLDEERLARLNDVSEDHHFRPGDWLVVPSQQSRQIKQLTAIDTSELRRTPPLRLPHVEERAIVRFGDTVVKIAQRYGLTLQELLLLNPGIETSRLVVGSQIRIAKASLTHTRMVLGLKPTTSGGISWPELPGFNERNKPFYGPSSALGWMWPTRGVFISGYGWREGKMHNGIGVANKVGTPIVASKSGRVVFSGWHDSRYGYMVTLSHADGSRSLYARNSRLMVRVGQDVEQGSLISLMGSSGHGADSFLHFEIHLQGSVAADPLQFLPGKAAALDPTDLGFGLTKGQDQPAPSPAAFGANPKPATSMPPAPAPMPLAQPLRPDPAALPSRPPAPFDASLDELVRDGVVSPEERARIRSGSGINSSVPAHQQACNSGALSQQECSSGVVVRWRDITPISGPTVKPLSPNEQAVLQRIRSNSYTPQWRTYGQCKYDWAGWRLNSNGTRTTEVECGGSAMRWTVGVSCDRLLLATYTTASGWSKWRTPAGPGNKSRQGEDEMVAALCANV